MKFLTTNYTKYLFILVTFSLFSNLHAQDKKWEVDLYKELNKVAWILQSNDGLIIAAGDKGL